MQVQGHVIEIKEKPTKAGYPMYDIKVNGDYYGVGRYPPRDVAVGDFVEFVAEMNGNFRNVGRGTLRKAQAPANAVAVSPSTANVAPPVKQPAGMTWDDKQATISKQAALNTAISMVELAVSAGAVNLGSNAAKGYGVLERMVMEQAARFHKFSTGVEVELPEVTPSDVRKPAAAKKAAAENPPDAEWADDELPEHL